jgi:hypothetical protein
MAKTTNITVRPITVYADFLCLAINPILQLPKHMLTFTSDNIHSAETEQ